jgi:hypothetical protein
LDFSGVIFGNYARRTDSASKAQLGGKSPNRFDVERVYLTFRMPAGERASIRATADIFQQTTDTIGQHFYRGWVLRFKYAYLQYNYLQNFMGQQGFNAAARIGMLHTVIIDHEEQFWPRYLGGVGVERFNFFSSSDLGIATSIALPKRFGEVYATVTNGPGYTAMETDRFKDIAGRVSFTPFAADSGFLQSFAITPWVYHGTLGSKFQSGGAGQVGAVTDGLERDRWGILAALRNRALTGGVQFAKRTDGIESGNNTVVSPRTVADQTGELLSIYALVRPLELLPHKKASPLGIVGRWDRFTPNTNGNGSLRYVVAGLFWDLNTRATLALDYQQQSPESGLVTPVAQKAWFLHWQATF